MVVVDKLSKCAHCITMKSTYKAVTVAKIFLKEIFRLHGVPKMVSHYFVGLEMKINFSTSYQPEIDGKTE